MLVLCGSTVSNYYNKVKIALLEKGIDFSEEKVATGSTDEAVLSATPLGKIPFIRTDHGSLCESQAILDYIEAQYPNPPLVPADPWQAAKVHELITFIDLHLELVARGLYPKAFFGGELSPSNAARIETQLKKNIAAFKRLAQFSPYVAGATFTQADCAAWASLPLVSMATRAAFGEDLLAAAGVDWKPYSKLVGERASAQKVVADRKADQQRAAAAKAP
ncbi:MAG: glutathione S-transferase [Burkholderiaceae bacterium]